ncbi:hypothetical protein MPC4_40181 [Methylocella tundrae]|uniref:Uncharacterized protein n=1 Tax=Methylocella tundrae TaxID=227605 RepID=A0A8B6M9J4_METTU|nr:hypothetical protein MPC4_40181 [Methylocella tundrae]
MLKVPLPQSVIQRKSAPRHVETRGAAGMTQRKPRLLLPLPRQSATNLVASMASALELRASNVLCSFLFQARIGQHPSWTALS